MLRAKSIGVSPSSPKITPCYVSKDLESQDQVMSEPGVNGISGVETILVPRPLIKTPDGLPIMHVDGAPCPLSVKPP